MGSSAEAKLNDPVSSRRSAVRGASKWLGQILSVPDLWQIPMKGGFRRSPLIVRERLGLSYLAVNIEQ
jgi:hypothetical protein